MLLFQKQQGECRTWKGFFITCSFFLQDYLLSICNSMYINFNLLLDFQIWPQSWKIPYFLVAHSLKEMCLSFILLCILFPLAGTKAAVYLTVSTERKTKTWRYKTLKLNTILFFLAGNDSLVLARKYQVNKKIILNNSVKTLIQEAHIMMSL